MSFANQKIAFVAFGKQAFVQSPCGYRSAKARIKGAELEDPHWRKKSGIELRRLADLSDRRHADEVEKNGIPWCICVEKLWQVTSAQ